MHARRSCCFALLSPAASGDTKGTARRDWNDGLTIGGEAALCLLSSGWVGVRFGGRLDVSSRCRGAFSRLPKCRWVIAPVIQLRGHWYAGTFACAPDVRTTDTWAPGREAGFTRLSATGWWLVGGAKRSGEACDWALVFCISTVVISQSCAISQALWKRASMCLQQINSTILLIGKPSSRPATANIGAR